MHCFDKNKNICLLEEGYFQKLSMFTIINFLFKYNIFSNCIDGVIPHMSFVSIIENLSTIHLYKNVTSRY